MSFWTYNILSAEQRWPALWNEDASTSRTTCSGSAVESTIMAFRPPVSATMTASGSMFSAMALSMTLAVLVDPVKHTPATRESEVRPAPTVAPVPGSS